MQARPKLLVLELWGLGDLVIATPFLRAASEKFQVTLIAKPFALELKPRFWPAVEVLPFTAPWTAFLGKYHFWNWPWREMVRLLRQLRNAHFDHAVSARWDPRDHLVLNLTGARERWGFPRLNSERLLTRPLPRPAALSHHTEYWRTVARALELDLPPGNSMSAPEYRQRRVALIHSGARLPVRVWPLVNYLSLASRLRQMQLPVQVVCDADQLAWWRSHGEQPECPQNVTGLLELIEQAGVFIGNDSGPGHLAAFCNVPTFTIFGPQLSEWFSPLSPVAEVFEGKACPYKPCSDYCRYPKPFCLTDLTVNDVWPRISKFAERHLSAASSIAT